MLRKKNLFLILIVWMLIFLTAGCSNGRAELNAEKIPINQIQGSAHQSPYQNKNVVFEGVVTAVDSSGFYMQSLKADNKPATSEAIYVFIDESETTVETPSSSSKEAAVGDLVTVEAEIFEYLIDHQGDFWVNQKRQLSITSAQASVVKIRKHKLELPKALVLGQDRNIPAQFDNDQLTSFDPQEDALDFYESLEGMLIEVKAALVVGPTNYGITALVANNGQGLENFTDYNGLFISENNFNPERIFLEGKTLNKIDLNNDGYADSYDLGTKFKEPIIGVLSYDQGKYILYNTKDYKQDYYDSPDNKRQKTNLKAEKALTAASYNLENFSVDTSDYRVRKIAESIVENLKAPAVIGLQEIQDNSGSADDGTVAADQSYNKLIEAIKNAGGPGYNYLNIDPENNQDGGAPGANIRVALLYNPKVIDFKARAKADALTAVEVEGSGSAARLSLNPGRIKPAAFNNSRKPLAAEFEYKGEKIFIIVCHLSSKRGDDPLFGNRQPPVNKSEAERIKQAQAVNNFAAEILAADSDASIIVLGDMNDFEFSETLKTLAGNELHNLMNKIPKAERYSYNFAGNSQILDHILVSDSLYQAGAAAEAVTVNSIFAEYGKLGKFSDHDPIIAQFSKLKLTN